MEGSGPLPKNAIVLTALQELVLSDSKKVHSVSNPAFHWGTTSILYRTLSCKQLPQNQHGVLRCPCQDSEPGSSVASFSLHLPPTYTHSAANDGTTRAAFLSFFPFFTLTPSSSVEKRREWFSYQRAWLEPLQQTKHCVNTWILLGSLRLHLFDKKYSKNSNIVKYYYNLIVQYFHIENSCDQSWIFSIITPVFSVTWSFRNHSNMLIYYQCWKQLCCFLFLYSLYTLILGFFDEQSLRG